MQTEDLAKTESAASLAARIRRKEISPVEAVESAIARIEAHNPKINALIIFGYDDARKAAKTAEAAIMRGDQVGGALLLLADVDETIEDDGDEAAQEEQIGERAGAELEGTEMETVGGEALGEPVLRCRIVENGVDGVRHGGQEERREHDASFNAAPTPGAEEQGHDQSAEDDLRGDGGVAIELLDGHVDQKWKQKHGDLRAAH